jgi:RHS repeat-associated protein
VAAVLDPKPTLAAAPELAADTTAIEILHGDVYSARDSWGTAPVGLDDGRWYTQAGKVVGAAGNDLPVSNQQVGAEPLLDPRQLVHDLFEPFGPSATLPEAPLATTLGTPHQPDSGGGGGAGAGAAGADHGSYGSSGAGSAPSGSYADLGSVGASSPAAPPATPGLPAGPTPAQPQTSLPLLAAKGAAPAPTETPSAPPAPLDPGLGGGGPPANPADTAQAMLANRPLNFEANVGQWDPLVKYSLQAPGFRLFLTGNEAVFGFNQTPAQPPHPRGSPPPPPSTLQYSFLHMQFVGANAAPLANGADQLAATTNYFLSRDPSQWHTNLPNYGQVIYNNVWSGVDVVYHGNTQKQLEYDFVVNPGANPHAVRLAYQGSSSLALDGQGNLVINVAGQVVHHHAPRLYQQVNGVQQSVSGNFVLASNGQISFNVGSYDTTRPLVIDPVVDFSTYLGGNGQDQANDIAVDSAGCVYVTGSTTSTNFPVVQGAFQPTLAGGATTNAFVTKFDRTGSTLLYSTYLGGEYWDQGNGIAVDASGNAYVAGYTSSTQFPVRPNPGAFQTTYNNGAADGFVTKLNPQGSGLVYSTFLGSLPPPPGGTAGSDSANAIAIDSAGHAFVTGLTDGTDRNNVFQTTPGAFQTSRAPAQPDLFVRDAFVTELTADGSGLVYSTYLGGTRSYVDFPAQSGNDITLAFGSNGIVSNVYVVGFTNSWNFRATQSAFQNAFGGQSYDAFVTNLNANLSGLVYSSFLGLSNYNEANALSLDQQGDAFVTGKTYSPSFPFTDGAFQTTFNGSLESSEAFVTAFAPAGDRLLYSTYLGGVSDSNSSEGSDIAVDRSGAAVVTGITNSGTFPMRNPLSGYDSSGTTFVTRFNQTGSDILFSSTWGSHTNEGNDAGGADTVDDLGNIYLAGATAASSFPTAYPYQPALGGSMNALNAFVTKIGPSAPVVPALGDGLLVEPASAQGGAPASGAFSANGVRYFDGSVEVAASDLGSAGFGIAWGQDRTWTNNPVYSFRSFNGFGWNDTQLPYLIRDSGNSNTIVAITRGTDARYFDLSGGVYRERLQLPDQLTYGSIFGFFALIDGAGNQLQFFDFSSNWPNNLQGQLASFRDAYGNATTVINWAPDGRITEVQRSSIVSGTTITESYLSTYLTSGINAGLLQNVTLRRQTNGGTWSKVRQVSYTYYDGTTPGGSPGDLMLAKIQDDGGNILSTYYYRYYKRGETGGFEHGLKYVFNPNSFLRLSNSVSNYQSAADGAVAPYADEYLQYDNQNRVIRQDIQGAGASDGTPIGIGKYTYSYATSTNAPGFNSWQVSTTETLPDPSPNITNVVYTNSYGEPMLTDFHEITSNKDFDTFHKYQDGPVVYGVGQLIQTANPSAVSGYNPNQPDLGYQAMSTSTGLVTIYDYYTSTNATETNAGGVTGYQQDIKIAQGTQGIPAAIRQSSSQYFLHTAPVGGNTVTVVPVANTTVYRNSGDMNGPTTSYGYTWFTGTAMANQVTVTLPAIASGQNGPGVADIDTTVNDTYGRPIWHKDADGFIDYTQYDQATGAMVKTITDVNTNNTNDFQGPAPWTSTPGHSPLHLITQMTVDALGRTTKRTDPAPSSKVTYTVYLDTNHEVRTYPGWNSIATPPGPTGPTEDVRQDLSGFYTETLTMTAAPNLTGNLPNGGENVSGLQTLARSYTNAAGQVVNQDDYFNLTGLSYSYVAHIGTPNTNYYETTYGYDNRGRQNSTTTPTGTLSVTDFDSLSRTLDTKVGTSTGNPTGNLVKTADYVYDNNTLGQLTSGVGDSNLTQVIQYPGGTALNRVSEYYYDWRDRQVASKDGVQGTEDSNTHRPIIFKTYDNLDEVTQVQQYDGDTFTISSQNPQPPDPTLHRLRAQTTTAYDDQGRVYQQQVCTVDQSSGTAGAALLTNNYYDHRGDLMAVSEPGGLWTKDQFDGAGRRIVEYTTAGAGSDTSWNAASTVSGDVVLAQAETTFDEDSNPIETIDRQRFDNDNASANGPLGTPTTGIGARVSYSGSYYDLANRLTATVDVGTNGPGQTWTRPTTPPTPSDTALVTGYAYNPAGWVQDVTDPRAIDARTLYDALGRTTETIANYTGSPETANSDVATEYTYDGDNNRLTVKADVPSGSLTPAGITQFFYGMTSGPIISNDLLAATIYPDPVTGQPVTKQTVTLPGSPNYGTFTLTFRGQQTSGIPYNADATTVQNALRALSTIGNGATVSAANGGGWLVQFTGTLGTTHLIGDGTGLTGGTSQVVAVASQEDTYTYNALGQVATMSDRIGNIHNYTFDVLGRQTADAVTTLVPGAVDPTLQQRIGRIETAYDTAGRPYLYTSYSAASGGAIVNQVQDSYNGLGQLTAEYQSHGMNAGTVQYAYNAMGAQGPNYSREISMTYPSGRKIDYNYMGFDNTISRLTSIQNDADGQILEQYTYLGEGTVVQRAHPENGVNVTYIGAPGDAGDQYTGLDRFGRVVDQKWVQGSTPTDEFQYGYDRDSNPLYRNNTIRADMGELYHRSGAGYGYDNLNQLTDFSRGTLSASGGTGGVLDTIAQPNYNQNWSLDALGNWTALSGSTSQTRTVNAQNEYTSVSNDPAPVYDSNGNLTSDETGKTLVYDPWNRLVEVKSGSTTLVTYGYDALGRRVTETENGTTREEFYSSAWQVVEERVGGSTLAQYVWSPVYVDALVERDQGGQRLYATQDANWNTTALVDTSGNVVERYAYDAYGKVSVLDGSWNPRSSSSYDNRYLFQGGRYDTQSGLYNFRNRDLSPTLGRWLENDPLGFDAGDSNLYRYVNNAPTYNTDPSGLQQMVRSGNPYTAGWAYPGIDPLTGLPLSDFQPEQAPVQKEIYVVNLLNKQKNAKNDEVVLKLAVVINGDNSLTTKLSEEPGLTRYAPAFPFDSAVAGAWTGDNKKFKDTDSVQVAVRWLDKDGKDVGHETNALPQKERKVGATWEIAGDKGKQSATWTTKTMAPNSAVRMDVILLYTDCLYNHADLSIIFGSFSATRKDAKSPWTIVENSEDLFPGMTGNKKQALEANPDSKELKALQQKTQDVLMKQTGYQMKRRIQANGDGYNSYYDTGYDIIIRK